MRNEENMVSFDVEFFRTCNKQITCKFCILQNKLVDHIDMGLYSKKRRNLLDILKKDIKTAVENNDKINHVNIHFSGGDFANVEDMVQYTIFLKDLIEYCKGLNLKLESYLTTNLLYIDKDGNEWKYKTLDEMRAMSEVFSLTTHINTSYAPEGRFNNVYEVLIWFKNLNEYNGLRFIHDKEYINVIIPLTKATVSYNSHNKVRGMLKRLRNHRNHSVNSIGDVNILYDRGDIEIVKKFPYLDSDLLETFTIIYGNLMHCDIYTLFNYFRIPYTFVPFMPWNTYINKDDSGIMCTKEYEENAEYYNNDRYYKDIESFLLKHAVKQSRNTKELFINHQFFSCMYNGNIKCYTLDGEVVKCLIDQNCTKEEGHGPLCCNLIADTEHLIRKITQIENNIREEIAKNEKG